MESRLVTGTCMPVIFERVLRMVSHQVKSKVDAINQLDRLQSKAVGDGNSGKSNNRNFTGFGLEWFGLANLPLLHISSGNLRSTCCWF